DGLYAITAIATEPGGTPGLPVALGTLLIDTVGPRVTGVRLSPGSGQILVTFQDERSGLVQTGLLDRGAYAVSRPFSPVFHPEAVTDIRAGAPGLPAAPQPVVVVVSGGRRVVHARFVLQVTAAGITDLAGNALDGEFTGPSLPSGNGQPGGDFLARLDFDGRRVFAPQPVSTPGALARVRRLQRVLARVSRAAAATFPSLAYVASRVPGGQVRG
ncbi:MAG TPA: DUF4394 domain-containing protein, partial [Isosphaeraceae bacterium]